MGVKNIEHMFRHKNGTAFMPFLVSGYPTFKKSLHVALVLVKSGADALEIGMPFSDPLADGPTIQAADVKAIQNGITPAKTFALVKKIRKFTNIPIVLMCYANSVLSFKGDFYKEAGKSGVDGVLVADVCLEEVAPFFKRAKQNNLANVMLIGPNTSLQRMVQIGKKATGFLYVVSVMGVTGQRKKIMKPAIQLALKARKITGLPACIGFGISTPAHIKQLRKNRIDGAIVGSALVSKIRDKNLNSFSFLASEMAKACN